MDLDWLLSRDFMFYEARQAALIASVVSILAAGLFFISFLRRIHPKEIDGASLFSLGAMGGIALSIFLSFPIFLLAAWLDQNLNLQAIFLLLAALLCGGILVLNLRARIPIRSLNYTLLALIFLVCGFGLVRLAFIRDLSLPLYSDSVEHYLVIADLLHPERPPAAFYQIERLGARYYHFGFHALAAMVAALSRAPVAQVMLVLGQILQAVIPISLFFLARRLTGSEAAGFGAAILAGIGWRMPAFASNWGKYPALAGVMTFLFTVSILHLAISAEGRKERLSLLTITVAAAGVSAVTHTRSVLLLALAAVSWWVAGRILRAANSWRIFAIAAGVSITAWVGVQISRSPELIFTIDPYLRAGLLPTLLVLSVLPFGWKYYPRPTISALLFGLFVLLCTLAPPPGALARLGYQTLLDRPFGQIILFLPLALVGGVGLGGLGQFLAAEPAEQKSSGLRGRIWVPLSLLLGLAVAVHAYRTYDFSPSPCCQLASEDDMAAFAWIEENLPSDAVILVASNRTPTRIFGVDGGIWITPLTGYRTEKWPYHASMDSADVLGQICAKGATHIYAGGTSARFSVERMESQPGWFARVFTRPRAYIYELIGCQVAP